MGFFEKFKKNNNIEVTEEAGHVYAPVTGRYILLKEVVDGVFSEGALGGGCGILPEEGKLYAPVSGEISMIADTKHAIGIVTENGAEYLLHIGLDTVDMNGTGFDVKVKNGSRVKAGQLLINFDLDQIKKAGHKTTTMFILTNEYDFQKFELFTGKKYDAGEMFGILKQEKN